MAHRTLVDDGQDSALLETVRSNQVYYLGFPFLRSWLAMVTV